MSSIAGHGCERIVPEEAKKTLEEIERSIVKRYRKPIWSKFIKAVKDYQLIEEGDRIAVAISGGKDSLLMAKLFQELKKHGQVNFEVEFIAMDPGYHPQIKDLLIENFEHLNIPYKNEKGKYQTYLFSKRAYDYVISSINKKNDTKGIMDVELKEYADRVIETFAMEDKKNEIYNKLSEIEKQGLGIKETLMEVFKVYSDNIDYLSANIDEILNSYKEGKGRVA